MQSFLCFLLAKGYESSREPWLLSHKLKEASPSHGASSGNPTALQEVSHTTDVVEGRKCCVASKQSWRDLPFCLSNSAALVSPLPAAAEGFDSFQHSVGRVLLKTCSCWLPACASGSLGLGARVLWCRGARHFKWTLPYAWNILVPDSLWGRQDTFADLCRAAALPLLALCHTLLPVQT